MTTTSLDQLLFGLAIGLAIVGILGVGFFAWLWHREIERNASLDRRLIALRGIVKRMASETGPRHHPLADALLSVTVADTPFHTVRMSDEQSLVNGLQHHHDFVGRDD